MPEYPDIALYLEALESRIVGRPLQKLFVRSAFVLRTAAPPPERYEGRKVAGLGRIGKRVVIAFEGELYAVIHLRVTGRLRWLGSHVKVGKSGLADFVFEHGTLVLAEFGTKRRASLHLVEGEAALAALDAGGLDPLAIDLAAFAARLRSESHLAKRALTDPSLFSGIGNAYSDEILHRARVSPFELTGKLDDDAVERLYRATRSTLNDWVRWLREEAGGGFPDKITSTHKGMSVHGKFGEPCPVCGSPVQRVVYSENEMNYCATCQTEGKIHADRAMSRLLHDAFPKHVDELG